MCFATYSTEKGTTPSYVNEVVNYSFTVLPFNKAVSSGQQWAIDKNNRIVYSSAGMCLTREYISSQFMVMPLLQSIKLRKCSTKEDNDIEFIFEPIFNNGSHKCANYS